MLSSKYLKIDNALLEVIDLMIENRNKITNLGSNALIESVHYQKIDKIC